MIRLPFRTSGVGLATTTALIIAAAVSSYAQVPPPASAPASAQSQPTTEPADPAAFDETRFKDLIGIIEGQNSPQARRAGARELLRKPWPEITPRLEALLRGQQQAAKTAVALALSDMPEALAGEYVEPLCQMLADPQEEIRDAASAALAVADVENAVSILRRIAGDDSEALPARRAAVATLGRMTDYLAVTALAELLANEESPVAPEALSAFEEAVGKDFQGDYQLARTWWAESGSAGVEEWRQQQIRRLAVQRRSLQQRTDALEQRLAATLREVYALTTDQKRPELLNSFLTDPSPAVRGLGLSLVQSQLTEGRTLADDTIAHTRELLVAREATVRGAAARTIAALRDPSDAERFRDLLAGERDRRVRQALVNGLGYVGSAADAPALVGLLSHSDPITVGESVTALGRLAERGVLENGGYDAVASALKSRISTVTTDEHSLRERILWAMSRLGDKRFAADFTDSLGADRSAGVRLAAVRGVAVLLDPKSTRSNGEQPRADSQPTAASNGALGKGELLSALVSVASDPDAAVRAAAVDALARHASDDTHLEALWPRIDAESEPEESIRVTAWRGAARVISTRPIATIETWLDKIPGDEATRRKLVIELLQLAEQHRDSKPDAGAELGWIRARLAAERAAAGQIDPAIASYIAALGDLGAAQSGDATRVALELLRLALLNGRYDEHIAEVLAGRNPALNGGTLWQGIHGEIEKLIQPDDVDRAIAMLAALETHPPASMPADTQQLMQEMLQRARAVQSEAQAAAVSDALAAFQADSEDQQAQEVLLQNKPLAIPVAREALRDTLQSEQPDANAVALLHDLLKQLSPEWPGFHADAPVEEKLAALESLPKQPD